MRSIAAFFLFASLLVSPVAQAQEEPERLGREVADEAAQAARGFTLSVPGTSLKVRVGAARAARGTVCADSSGTMAQFSVTQGKNTVVDLRLLAYRNAQSRRCLSIQNMAPGGRCWRRCAPSIAWIKDSIYGATVVPLGLAAAGALFYVAVPMALLGVGF